jgi:HPt (histidine-containing phosphotransfer) domain-containing protein
MRRIRHTLPDTSIDRAVLDRLRTTGGEDLVIGLLDLYLKFNPVRMEELFQAMKISDFELIRDSAHALVSSAGNLGGELVSSLAKDIEFAATEQKLSTIERLAGELYQANAIFINYLKEQQV